MYCNFQPCLVTKYMRKFIPCLLYLPCVTGLPRTCIHNLEFLKQKFNLLLMVHTGIIPMKPRLGQSLIGWVTLHSKCTITLYGICLQTRKTLERFSLNLKITLSQPKMSIIAGTCLEACIPPSLNLRVIS